MGSDGVFTWFDVDEEALRGHFDRNPDAVERLVEALEAEPVLGLVALVAEGKEANAIADEEHLTVEASTTPGEIEMEAKPPRKKARKESVSPASIFQPDEYGKDSAEVC